MHRRNLILRRFGAMSFGFGYFDDGVWVDHSVAAITFDELTPDERAALDAVHAWFPCCGGSTDAADARMTGAITSATS
jgi:hypothetical protein